MGHGPWAMGGSGLACREGGVCRPCGGGYPPSTHVSGENHWGSSHGHWQCPRSGTLTSLIWFLGPLFLEFGKREKAAGMMWDSGRGEWGACESRKKTGTGGWSRECDGQPRAGSSSGQGSRGPGVMVSGMKGKGTESVVECSLSRKSYATVPKGKDATAPHTARARWERWDFAEERVARSKHGRRVVRTAPECS